MLEAESSRRRQLGEFLKIRREAIRPESLGLPAGRRRRTPGLRREELADLAGISAVWFARIEQGRDVSPSPHALARLAQALRLGRAERAHLFELAAKADPAARDRPAAEEPSAALRDAVEACTAPAYLLDRAFDIRAHNAPAAALFAGWFDDGDAEARPNLLRTVFLDPAARDLIVGWSERARRLAAEFRADFVPAKGSAAGALVAELAASSPDFAAMWKEQRVLGREGGERRFRHPTRGELAFRQVTLVPAEEPDFKLVMLLPA
ncbi:helix-turn-helix transcriptional regulator [Aureimonas leprariae]|uniref:Helix-turn-helix domain-containing protein n=1 Tax=Plantimonas leprariae TaxID=2615207 RepID=A0A7V7TXK7_9HYPH|nr:helix-turn-helix transcriptional regulator [Aureimonas leprariae]KAB0681446.1 helix-turn-helix domain-containing protein [Aureimonas leprariae]